MTKRNINFDQIPDQQQLSTESSSSKSNSKYVNFDVMEKEEYDKSNKIVDKSKEFLGKFEECPVYCQDNEFLRSGYRINFNSARKALKSFLIMHNETLNIWTHLAGSLFITGVVIYMCFTVHAFDAQVSHQFAQEEATNLFGPVYGKLNLAFNKPDIQTLQLPVQTIPSTLGSVLQQNLEEIEKTAKNLTPETIGTFLCKLNADLEAFLTSSSNVEIYVNQTQQKDVRSLATTFETKLKDLQDMIISNIDSKAIDWLDIYKYIKASYMNQMDHGYVRKVPLSRWPIIVFLISAIFCTTGSAIFHGFLCISEEVNDTLRRLDYAGISILSTGSSFPTMIYGFYCQFHYAQLYLTIGGSTSLLVFFISLGKTIHLPEYTKVKALMYAGLGIFSALPLIHLYFMTANSEGINDNITFAPSFGYFLMVPICYLGGLTLYAFRLPECCAPGKFDMGGHSHNLWHLCVLTGILFTYLASTEIYYERINIPCIDCC